MAGLVPAIPAGTSGATDGRDRPGHDVATTIAFARELILMHMGPSPPFATHGR